MSKFIVDIHGDIEGDYEIISEYEEPKSGHWEMVAGGYGLTDKAFICKCSECDDTVWCYIGSDREWKYCPSCGARMIHSKEVKCE